MTRWLLWDLDGTLVYWRSRLLIPYVAWLHLRHFGRLHGHVAALRHLGGSYRAMLRSRGGERLNRVFLGELSRRLGVDPEEAEAEELDFVARELACLEEWIAPVPGARETFHDLVATGRYRMVAATNPTMPVSFNRQRLEWAGYPSESFEYITGTETSSCLKKYPDFYRELLGELGAGPEECLMIGNDGRKDLIAAREGIPVFLLDAGFLVNQEVFPDLAPVGTGDFRALGEYLGEGRGDP